MLGGNEEFRGVFFNPANSFFDNLTHFRFEGNGDPAVLLMQWSITRPAAKAE